ncbi:MAG TPA: glycosyltransferase family 9 protein [Elusimicrobiales bacterium]|nr:glycosyltransferase family 9 protein [Elusimicrobiales bacterium]
MVAFPAFQALRAHYRDAHITLLHDAYAGQLSQRDILKHTNLVDSYLAYNPATGLRGKIKLFNTIRRNRYSEGVNLAESDKRPAQYLRDRLFFYFAGIEKLIGFTKPAVGGDISEQAFLAAFLSENGIACAAPTGSVFSPTPGQIRRCEEIISERLERWRGQTLVAFAPGSNMPVKRWPLSRFARLGGMLVDRFGIVPVVLGGASDQELGESLVGEWGAGVNLAGVTDILQSYIILGKCALYVGNDTGTMHLAAYAGTKCVAIFSSRDRAGKWSPSGEGHIVLRKEMDCSGCMRTECGKTDTCISGVTIEETSAACAAVLERKERVATG